MTPLFEIPGDSGHFYHVTPDEVNRLVAELEGLRCPDLRIDRFPQFDGRTVYALTFTAAQGDWRGRKRLFLSRPHAHEPAGVAAQTELAKVLAGWGDYGSQNREWCRWALENFVITLVPDANPSGSQRAPVKFWDGSYCENRQFYLWMFGESGEEPGARFPRVPAWDMREVTPPALLGICYERLDEYTYLEPNRDRRSTFFRSFEALDKNYGYQVWLDLHQTEFEHSNYYNTEVFVPVCIDQLDEAAQEKCRSLGNAIIERWQRDGGQPVRTIPQLYKNNPEQARYLVDAWLDICRRVTHVISEVQNNAPRTPPVLQVRLEILAVLETLEWMERALPAPQP